jgi:hypothetical protein
MPPSAHPSLILLPAPCTIYHQLLVFPTPLDLQSQAIIDDPQSSNWTVISEMVDILTPEQRDAAEWRISHSGKIAMQDFQVST